MRFFPSHIEKMASACFEIAFTEENWTVLGERTATASAAVLVELETTGARAFAKPANPNSHRPSVCAAHEKIVSDLAFLLGLPVPPVVLSIPSQHLDFPPVVALSIVPFPQCRKWSERASIQEFAPSNMLEIASAMSVFHTFVCDTDHGGNDGNQVIDHFMEDRYQSGIAFIDYAYSLTHLWDWSTTPPTPNPQHSGICGAFDGSFTTLDKGAQLLMAERIQSLDEGKISEIVQRIPDVAMPKELRDLIVSFLCERKRIVLHLMR